MHFIGIVPARYASTRLPGKVLLPLCGKPMIQWVWERARASRRLEDVIVATDDERIRGVVEGFGGRVEMTSPEHASGTDRIAEVAGRISADVFVNIQGDEPVISPNTIDAVCACFEDKPDTMIATARVRLEDEQALDPDVVKVVTDSGGRALYFSRAQIPYRRGRGCPYFKHIGIYGYRRNFLLGLQGLRPSALEESEKLEQLRFLDNGFSIQVVTVESDSIGVDNPADLERVRPLLENPG